MFESLDPRSPTPLYEQIAQRIRLAIAAEELCPGDALPSVRRMATELRVNPATVVRAYRDLERDGFVSTRHGTGTFVNELPGRVRAAQRAEQALALVRDLITEAARLGISRADLVAALHTELDLEDHELRDSARRDRLQGRIVSDPEPEPQRS
ncbi:MAG: GntR family transcriptional regulator [Gemmatimonadetes bacterium]|nr:MAG: GntR family transcriptional regulator [Gemmatimonadota bacterium]